MNITFNESSWDVVESSLPDDPEVKKVVLDDYMWFMGKTKKYKNNREKIEDYLRHLRLKQKSMHLNNPKYARLLGQLEIRKIESCLTINILNRDS